MSQAFNLSVSETFRPYAVTAAIVGVVFGLVSGVLIYFANMHSVKMHSAKIDLVACGMSLGLLVVISIVLGPYQVEIPNVHESMFFAEYNFFTVIFEVALPTTFIVALISWFSSPTRRRG